MFPGGAPDEQTDAMRCDMEAMIGQPTIMNLCPQTENVPHLVARPTITICDQYHAIVNFAFHGFHGGDSAALGLAVSLVLCTVSQRASGK